MKRNDDIADTIDTWYSCANIMFPEGAFIHVFFFLIKDALRTTLQSSFDQPHANAMSS